MLKNYFKIAWRNLGKHKSDTSINLIGLCVAFTAALLLFLSVYYEFSFDRFHKNHPDIYAAYYSIQANNGVENSNSMPIPFLPALKLAYPQVKYGVRNITKGVSIEYKDKKLHENLRLTDPDFFSMFSFPFVKGNAKTALNDLHSVVLREGTAKAVFGDEEAIGKIIQLQTSGGWQPFTVTGILSDFPRNSSISCDVIIRFENADGYAAGVNRWNNWNHTVYLQLQPGTAPVDLEMKSVTFTAAHFAEDIERLKRDGTKPAPDGQYMKLKLLPFSNIHTDPTIQAEGSAISRSYLYLLLVVGVLILLIACINFVNLSVCRAFTRSHEIGLRKTLGAQRGQLALQFWSEAFLICLFAFFASCIFCYLLLPFYKQLFVMNITRDVLFSPAVWLGMIVVFLLIAVLAGGYPAWLMANLNIVNILKGKLSIRQSKGVRNVLIVVQFSIAILLIICTLVSWNQINYLRSRPLGYNRTQVISIPVGGDVNPAAALSLMRQQLSAQPAVESISGIYDNLGRGLDGSSRTSVMGFDYKNREIKSHWIGVSYDFVKTLDIKLNAGRDFSREYTSDSNAVVINEAMAQQLGEKKPVGTLLPVHDSMPPMEVIGVVTDFNFQSLRSKVEPLTLVLEKEFEPNYILIKVKAADPAGSMKLLENTWKAAYPGSGFQGSFLNENIERQYRREQRLGQIFIAGAVIAIVLSCMGLLAIVLLIVAQRVKEIGVRKVLGASVFNITALLSKDFLKLVVIALLVASPVAWWVMHKWLQDFPYRISIAWWMFLIAGLLSVLIALATVSIQAIRAALANPVKSLRAE